MITDKVIGIEGRQKGCNIRIKKYSRNREPKNADKNYSKIFLKLNFLKLRKKIQAAFRLLQRNIQGQKIKGQFYF